MYTCGWKKGNPGLPCCTELSKYVVSDVEVCIPASTVHEHRLESVGQDPSCRSMTGVR